MAQYSSVNGEFPNLQLNKLKSGMKIGNEVTLNLSSNVIGSSSDEKNCLDKLFLNNRQA